MHTGRVGNHLDNFALVDFAQIGNLSNNLNNIFMAYLMFSLDKKLIYLHLPNLNN